MNAKDPKLQVPRTLVKKSMLVSKGNNNLEVDSSALVWNTFSSWTAMYTEGPEAVYSNNL